MHIDQLSDSELGAHVRQRHHHLAAAHAAGLVEEHPSTTWNKQAKAARTTRDSLPGNLASSKEITLHGDPSQEEGLTGDDPIPTRGVPRVERPGMTAVDEELAIRRSGSSDPEEDIRQARLRRNGSSPTSVRAMVESIPGYARLK